MSCLQDDIADKLVIRVFFFSSLWNVATKTFSSLKRWQAPGTRLRAFSRSMGRNLILCRESPYFHISYVQSRMCTRIELGLLKTSYLERRTTFFISIFPSEEASLSNSRFSLFAIGTFSRKRFFSNSCCSVLKLFKPTALKP